MDIQGLFGYEDFVRLVIGGVVLSFFPLCQLHNGHVKVDMFLHKDNHKYVYYIDKFWLVIMGFLSLFLLYWLILGMIETYNDNAVSRVLGWIEWPFYLPSIFSILIWFLVIITMFFHSNKQN